MVLDKHFRWGYASVNNCAGAQTDSHADLRLAALTQLYNVVVDAPLQLRVLLRTLAYAKAANLAGLLAPVVKARPHRGSRLTSECAAPAPLHVHSSDPISQDSLLRLRHWVPVRQHGVCERLGVGPV